MPPPDRPRGYTVADVAKRYRVSPDKVRAWIRKGELKAVNVAASLLGKPQLRVTAEALTEFERRRSAAVPTPEAPKRRRRRAAVIDYYPDY
jgi:excisionase family DNA binding protein